MRNDVEKRFRRHMAAEVEIDIVRYSDGTYGVDWLCPNEEDGAIVAASLLGVATEGIDQSKANTIAERIENLIWRRKQK
jgi:hypothetical protein